MLKAVSRVLLLVLLAVTGTSLTAAAQQQRSSPAAPTRAAAPPPPSVGFADLAERLLPAVVNISTTQTVQPRAQGQERGPEVPQFPPGSPFEDFFRDFLERQGRQPNAQPRRATSLGSGFIIDGKEGLVVTNNHVIDGADEITVILHNDTNLKATLVGRDTKTDLALLRVPVTSGQPLPSVSFGDSDKIRVGNWVLAIGNPFGLGGTVTAGIISARARDIQAGPYDDFLQTDAPINRGNSGGPMFDLAGGVIGVNTAIYSPTGGSIGIGFAIPANLVRGVIDQLREFGRTRRGWLGVKIQSVTDDIAEGLQLEKARGALIASVTPGGPAAEGGVMAGDIVVNFNNRSIEEMRRLPRIVADTAVDTVVPVEVWRKGRKVALRVKVGELEAAEQKGLMASAPSDAPKPAAGDDSGSLSGIGVKLAALTGELRQKYEIKGETRGVVVTEVREDSLAAQRGLRAGDVIVEAGQEVVMKPTDINLRIQQAKEQNRRSILLLVDRQGDLRFVALNIPE